MNKVQVSCSYCDADYKIFHDLDEPYIVMFCAFCGEAMDEELIDWEEDDEYNEYNEYD